ncbi:MAG TPA: DUF6541 family protein [Pseudonocardiaceae bacterium]|nr:DUF6541 family protein [Pseudonocardiaceae bacterium]
MGYRRAVLREVVLVVGYAALLWLPGAAVGALLGLGRGRWSGWSLAALAPLLTYGIVTVCGPWMSRLGIAWQPGTAGLALLVVLAVAAVLRWPLRRWTAASRGRPEHAALPAWTMGGHVAVGLATVASGLFGGAVLLSAFGGLASIPQDWDAMLHANGIRYIAETGDSGVYGMYSVNTFASGGQVYYPNSYHLLATVMVDLTGATIPAVLNAHSMLMPLMLALMLVAVVRCFHGRVALAVFAALVSSMATAVPYDLIWRGPLLPFATGLVLSLGIVVALQTYLDRPSVLLAVALLLAGAGLLGLHPSMLFTAALFALPMLGQRWWQRPRRIGVELGLLVLTAVLGAALVLPHVAGALSTAPSVLAFTWPQEGTPAQALGEVFGFSTMQTYPQVWLVVFLVIGMGGFRSLGRLRWLPVAGFLFAALFVLSASYSTPWAQKLTSVWWNDKYRLAAAATIALLPVVAHGLVRTHDAVLHRLVLPVLHRLRGARRPGTSGAALVTLTAVWATVFLLADSGYAQRNIERTSQNYGHGPDATVSPAERKAFEVLQKLVKPDERVMNDRFDGSGWMYALSGVRPVAAHYSKTAVGDGPELLAGDFNHYDSRPDVQEAVARLHIRWVIVSSGFVRSDMSRQQGLVHLSQVRALDLVYDEGGVQIYQIARPAAPGAPPSSLPASAPGAEGSHRGPG